MFTRSSLILLLMALLFLRAATCGAGVAPAHNHIPPIAHIAGFTVGVSNIEQMERHFGPAFRFVGVHPNSNHSWWATNLRTHIVADYSDTGPDGAIVDQLEIDCEPSSPGPGVGDTHAPRRTATFMGTVQLGMSRAEVLRLLRGRLPAPQVPTKDGLAWKMRGYAVIHPPSDETQGSSDTIWTASLHFSHGRLDSVEVECG